MRRCKQRDSGLLCLEYRPPFLLAAYLVAYYKLRREDARRLRELKAVQY